MKKHVFGLATMPLIVAGTAGVLINPAFAEGGNEPISCTGMQNAIDSAPDNTSTMVSVTGDCAANITVPSGKNIILNLNTGSLSDSGGDTITVADGAFIYLHNGTFINSTNGKAIVNNSGLAVVDAGLTASNGAYSIINTGEVNIVDTVATGFKVNNSGTLRIAYGEIDNVDEARPYVTGALNEEGRPSMPSVVVPELMPLNYKTVLQFQNPALAATYGFEITGSDDNILSIEGSALSGYQIEARSAGMVDIGITTWLSGAGGLSLIYDVNSNTEGLLNQDIYDYLVENYGYIQEDSDNPILQALDEDKEISVNLYIDEMQADDVNEEEKAAIDAAADGDTIISYGDVTLAVETNDGDLIDEIEYLTPCAGDAGGNVVCKGAVNVTWPKLDLGKPAEGYQRNYYAIRMHNGKATKIAASLNEDGNIVFPSGMFSTYAIAYEDTEIPQEDNAKTPETGMATHSDNGKAIASLIGCIAAGIVVAFTMMPRIKKYLASKKA